MSEADPAYKHLNKTQFKTGGDDDDDFSLPPEQEAYYKAQADKSEMTAKDHADYRRELRTKDVENAVQYRQKMRSEGTNPNTGRPFGERTPREPRPPDPARQAQRTAKNLHSLARKARGRRR